MTQYITGEEVADLIKSDQVPGKDYLVVDVRGDDFEGGNIVGMRNIPSDEFLKSVAGLVKDAKDTKKVIFHYHRPHEGRYKLFRGPKAASIYKETRESLARDGYLDKPQEILVLQGGFSQFQTKYKDDSLLVENWDKKIWNE